jgi:hypothetical protein
VGSSDAGLYQVTVTNAAGRVVSRSAVLRVIAPLRVSRPPTGGTYDLGAALELSAGIEGTAPVRWQWRLNGQDIPGATNAVYRVEKVAVSDAGLYTVVVENEAGAVTSPSAEVRVSVPERPAGDDFAGAVALEGLSWRVSGSNAAATRETGEPEHVGKPGGRSVWYRWTAPVTGRVRMETTGSAFDTLLAVYTGTGFADLVEVAGNDDRENGGFFTSEVAFGVVAGTRYWIALDGLGGADGRYLLGWEAEAASTPVPRIVGQPASQTVVAGTRVELRVGVEGAATVVWRFNGQELPGATTNPLVLGAVGPGQVGRYVAVVRGGGVEATSREAIVEIGPQAGVRSYDKPEEAGGGAPGAVAAAELQAGGVGLGTAPALLVSAGPPVSQWVNNAAHTTQQGERNHCEQLVRRTGWLPVRVGQDGHLVIAATHRAVPVVLAVYEDAAAGRSLACAEGGVVVVPGARANAFYWVAYGDGSDAASGGPIELVCTAGVPPSQPTPAAPELRTVGRGEPVTLRAPSMVGVNPVPRYVWLRDGVPIAGATGAEYTLAAPELASGGAYSVEVDNGVGRARYEVAQLAVDQPFEALPTGLGMVGNDFEFSLRGNPGQRIRVHKGISAEAWTGRDEFWLPASGSVSYRDPGAMLRGSGFYQPQEVGLEVEPWADYLDGSRGWRVSGGRLGDRYVLERSADGVAWGVVLTNRVTEASYLHVEPAGSPGTFRARQVVP